MRILPKLAFPRQSPRSCETRLQSGRGSSICLLRKEEEFELSLITFGSCASRAKATGRRKCTLHDAERRATMWCDAPRRRMAGNLCPAGRPGESLPERTEAEADLDRLAPLANRVIEGGGLFRGFGERHPLGRVGPLVADVRKPGRAEDAVLLVDQLPDLCRFRVRLE